MSDSEKNKELIFNTLKDVACTKQQIYRESINMFQHFKAHINVIAFELMEATKDMKQPLEILVKENGEFEVQLTIAGDLLLFTLHTNVFNFDENHFVHKTAHVQEDPSRSYCSMIRVYNFLADSFRFHRMNDLGYMIARIFINKDRHFFVEGKRQLGFLYTDFNQNVLTEDYIRAIIESAILYSLDFDLLVPPYDQVKMVSLMQVLQQKGMTAVKTGKRLGFSFQADSDVI